MARTLSGYDKGLLIFAIILCCLAISSLAVTGVLSSGVGGYASLVYNTHYGVGAWILVIGIIGIVAGATGSHGAYIAVIVLTILGVFAALAGIGVGIYGFVAGIFLSSNTYEEDGVYHYVVEVFNLSIGLVIIDGLTFVFLIVASCIACCGTCNQPTNPGVYGTTTVVHSSAGGAVMMQGPTPGYAQYPPQQGYAYPNDGYYNQSGGEGGAVPMNQYAQKS